jgi:hypothetical protein
VSRSLVATFEADAPTDTCLRILPAPNGIRVVVFF